MRAYLLQWLFDSGNVDDRFTVVVLADNVEDAETAVYRHHVETDAHLRGTIRRWSWRELPVVEARSTSKR